MVGGFPGCCARAVSGHAAAELASSVMNWRRLTSSMGLLPCANASAHIHDAPTSDGLDSKTRRTIAAGPSTSAVNRSNTCKLHQTK
jgi:hypothetical protein